MVEEKEARKPECWRVFREVLGSPRHVVAPMVDGSVLPFRLLCRRHGADLAYTPMIFASIFVKDPTFRRLQFASCPADRPVVAQLCGSDAAELVETARLLERWPHPPAAIDLNLGCPQKIAKKGAYGAFLADSPETVRDIVEKLRWGTRLPVFCKMRLMSTLEQTLAFARMLEDAGAMLITVHGRTRAQVDLRRTEPDWGAIAAVVEQAGVPVIANGGIRRFEDVERCLAVTHAQAVMVGSALLANPAFFSGNLASPEALCTLALELMDIAQEHPMTISTARGLLCKLLLQQLRTYGDCMEQLVTAGSVEEMHEVVREVDRRVRSSAAGVAPFLPDPPPWGLDSTSVELSLHPGPGFLPWRDALTFARAPYSKGRAGDSGGWLALIGLGRRYLPTEVLRSLRESLQARAWHCRDCAVYFDLPGDAQLAELANARHATVYYRILPAGDPSTQAS